MDFFKNIKDNVIKGRQDKALEKRKEMVAWQLTQLKTLPSYGMKQHVDTLQQMIDKATEGVVTQAVRSAAFYFSLGFAVSDPCYKPWNSAAHLPACVVLAHHLVLLWCRCLR